MTLKLCMCWYWQFSDLIWLCWLDYITKSGYIEEKKADNYMTGISTKITQYDIFQYRPKP